MSKSQVFSWIILAWLEYSTGVEKKRSIYENVGIAKNKIYIETS